MTSELLTFDADTHTYTLTGRRVRSVTQLLRKVNLITPFEDVVPPWVLGPALKRGTAVHRALELLHDPQDPLDLQDYIRRAPEYAGYVQSWVRLLDTGRLETFAVETRVANFAPRYAGTFDWLGTFDGQACMVDFATGDPYDSCKGLQLAGYVLAARAWAQTPGQEALQQFFLSNKYILRYAARLQRDGKLPQLTCYTDPRDFSLFLLIAQTVAAVDEERPKWVDWNWQHDDAAVYVNA
jgi:hypothetical protein